MNRQIKFRCKDLETSKWVYGSLLQDDYGTYQLVSFIDHHETWHDVAPETIGQFTGLLDRNGIEIYEGDVVFFKGKNYLVKFWDGMFYASVEECNRNVYGGLPLHALTTSAEDGYVCEVIGNGYDNPELLENYE